MFTLVLVFISLSLFFFTNEYTKNQALVLFAFDDSDIKIAPDRFSDVKPFKDNAAEEGDIYFLHKQKGNILKAHEIGKELAKVVAEYSGTKRIENFEFVNFQTKALVAFVVERCIGELSPDSILAKSSKTVFYEEIKKFAPHAYDFIINSGSYSMYMLCIGDSSNYSECVGRAFAKSCQRQDDERFIKMGSDLYTLMTQICEEKFANINYKKI